MIIDTTYNFQSKMKDPDTDADKYSKVLQEYHRLLWSKQLPNRIVFTLEKLNRNCLLQHISELGNFTLSSDRAIPTYLKKKGLTHITSKISKKDTEFFVNTTETIGGIIIWPSIMIDGKMTINAAKGCNSKIADRLDLTIECIRRYYLNEESPLFSTLKRYKTYFDLFKNFKNFVDFFLLQDAVSNNYKSVIIAPPFDDFKSNPIPTDEKEYLAYMKVTIKFIKARNKRIANYAARYIEN